MNDLYFALAVGCIDRRLSAFDRRRMITIAMLRRSHPTDAAPPRHRCDAAHT